MDAGVLLRRARAAAELSQRELAQRAGTSRPTLSAYEHGRKSPSADTLKRLLSATGHELDTVPCRVWNEYRVGRGRTGWVASGLWRLPVADALGEVVLPLHLNWSVPGKVFALRDRRQRARLYEVLLREGSPEDLVRYLDGVLLVDAWPELVLPRAVRDTWQPLIDATVRAGHARSVERPVGVMVAP
jgi:transcriptional regulator with XRE-family HTH domain